MKRPQQGVVPSAPQSAGTAAELGQAHGRLPGVSSRGPRINSRLVRAYDLRGAVGRELGSRDAEALGLAFATAARAEGRVRVVVGRDGRLSSPELEAALVEGLVAGGLDVTRLGLGPTPLLHFAIDALGFEGGIMVTGSHNPPGENGFKLVLGADPVHGRALRELVATDMRRATGGRTGSLQLIDDYCARLAASASRPHALRVVWDCGNGAAGAVIGNLTRRLPGEHILLNARVDGRFPAHHPDPAVAANLRELQAAVVARGADLGIAFDGDGDRIGVVDDSGTIVWADQLLLLLAREVLEEHPGSTIVGDVKSSRVLFEGIERLGGRPLMVPSGYVLVREAMLRARAPLGGEMSGHILYESCWHCTDDALYVAVRTMNVVSRLASGLAEFRRTLPATLTTPEIRFACPEHRKLAVMGEVAARLAACGADVSTLDGVRVSTRAGWWLLRASGTEPKLTARCEASDAEGLREACSELARQLEESGVECPEALRGGTDRAISGRIACEPAGEPLHRRS